MIDMSEAFTDKFYDDVKIGQVIGFNKDGITTHYKIVKLDRKNKKCFTEEVKLYTQKEIQDMPDEQANKIMGFEDSEPEQEIVNGTTN